MKKVINKMAGTAKILKVLTLIFMFGLGISATNNALLAKSPGIGKFAKYKNLSALDFPGATDKAHVAIVYCENPGDESCGDYEYKKVRISAKGNGKTFCNNTSVSLDFGLAFDITSASSAEEQTTCVFIPKHQNSVYPTNIGTGYIGATVKYAYKDGEFIKIYTVCNANKIDGYKLWLKACIDYYDN